MSLTLTDEEIAHAANTANLGEVDQGEVAVMRAQDEDVQDYAEMMVTAHTTAATALQMLASDNDIELVANPVSALLQTESAAIVLALEAAPEAQFDELYVQSQVEVHSQVLEFLDEQWLEQVEDPELRAFLEAQRDDVAEHLEMAEELLETL